MRTVALALLLVAPPARAACPPFTITLDGPADVYASCSLDGADVRVLGVGGPVPEFGHPTTYGAVTLTRLNDSVVRVDAPGGSGDSVVTVGCDAGCPAALDSGTIMRDRVGPVPPQQLGAGLAGIAGLALAVGGGVAWLNARERRRMNPR